MSNALPDFLSDEPMSAPVADAPAPPVAEAPQSDPAPSPDAAPAAEGQPRAPDGKFAPKAGADAAPAAPAAPVVAEAPIAPEAPPQAPPAQPQAHAVPLATFLDIRDKAAAAERRANEAEAWRRDQEARAQRAPAPQAPDPDADPAGYRAFQNDEHQRQLWEMRVEMSRGFAITRHGEETANKAFDWGLNRCDADPFFNAKVKASPDPVAFVVAEWQREQLLSEMAPEEVVAFKAWKAAQTTAAPAQPALTTAPTPAAAAQPPAPPAQPPVPRPSLAAGPSAATGAQPIPRDAEATFDRMFAK